MPLFISNLVLLDGWRRLGLTFLAGALAGLTQAPLGWFVLLWICVPVLIWMLDSATLGKGTRDAAKAMFTTGWMFGFGFFLVTFYWLGAAFLVEADKFAWAMPLAILILPAGLALFWGAGCASLSLVWSASPLRAVWLALALSAMEWLRGHILTGLPWGGFGQALAANTLTMQALSIVGPYGLTLFAFFLFSLPVLVFSTADHRNLGRKLAVFAGVLFVIQLGYGAYRLSSPTEVSVDNATVRLIQPNIPQKEKWKFENRSWIFNRLLALTTINDDQTPSDAVDLVIWPESALPFYLIEQPGALAAIVDALPQGAGLLTGALRREQSSNGADVVYNSIYQLGHDGTILGSYDKVHLVPFGEYLPKQFWLEAIGLEQLTVQRSGFASGTRRRLLKEDHLGSILPVICYEVAFSSELLSYPDNADVIVNVTNDAWFGATAGPHQHLLLARMRAVETGLPVLRVANTGISAIIDGHGKVMRQLSLETGGILQEKVPTKLPKTFYSLWGNWIFFAMWLTSAIVTSSIRRKVIKA